MATSIKPRSVKSSSASLSQSTTLPQYILDRNRLALEAGLTIERQDFKHGALTTWYRGTEAQWRATPFCFREKRFTNTHMGMDAFVCFSPAKRWLLSVQRRQDKGDFRGSMPHERLPERTEKLGDGISVYTMHADRQTIRREVDHRVDCERYSVYVGEGEALVDWKIAPAEILHNKDRDRDDLVVKTADGSCVTVWQREILPDGRYAFFDFGMPSEDKLKISRSFGAASQLTSSWAAFVQNVLTWGEEEYLRARGPSGKRFAVTSDSLETIKEVAEELVDAIRCATVVTREPTPPKVVQPPWRSKAARVDTAFQELLAGLSSNKPTNN